MKNKETKLSNGSNKLFEGSRFIMPQHREAAVIAAREELRQSRPLFDEQRIQDLSYAINEAINERSQVNISIFGEFGNTEEQGWISRIDQLKHQIRLETGDRDFEWIKLEDIVDIQVR
ncbi:YolD-like family protein [Paenibacillus sp. TAB 01]|uniref:YolD-like family protein n=1 Tax=Paenibacillus sp. TAB 01 TaxID=3368988 RepID=UPI0037527586